VAQLIDQILSLSKAERLKIAMQILMSIQNAAAISGKHIKELSQFQKELKAGNVTCYSEEAFCSEARKRIS